MKQTCREWLRVNSVISRCCARSDSKARKQSKAKKQAKVLHRRFHKKTLDLLDNKYKTVAKQQGVNRSLVIKREKNKSKILAELTLTMTKKNKANETKEKYRWEQIPTH